MICYSQTLPRSIATTLLLLLVAGGLACADGGSTGDQAYVVPEKIRLRSSTAQASRMTSELRGADAVTITNRLDAEDGTPWVEVRGPVGETGWAEARFFVAGDLVEASRRIAEQYKSVQTQAAGRSKAALRLRLTPDRLSEENVALTLPAGTLLDIITRERRPRPATLRALSDADEVSQSGSSGSSRPSGSSSDQRFDDWLLVRVRDFSVVSTGWIYGGSVSIEPPPEIIYFISSGYRIAGWQRIGTVTGEDGQAGHHYLVLEEKVKNRDSQFDFDRVKVLAYDPVTREYTTPFREDLSGRFPLTLEMNGTRGAFRLTVVDRGGSSRDLQYQIELLEQARLRVTRLNNASREAALRKNG
jgi:hypothetical protein